MNIYRTYRENIPGLNCFRISIGETDLWIESSWDCNEQISKIVRQLRIQIRSFIEEYPTFAETLDPWDFPEAKSKITSKPIISMLEASNSAGVGPMAAVAGAIAGIVGENLYQDDQTLIIENGGDIYLSSPIPRTVGIYAGDSRLSSRIVIRITPEMMPIGVCTSAGKVGPSHSIGRAHAAVILSKNTALADAVATAAGNKVRCTRDIKSTLDWVRNIPGVLGAIVIIDESMGVWGQIELVPTNHS